MSSFPTATKLAANYGVDERTIKRDGQFARAVEDLKKADPTIEQRVHSGKVAKQSVVAANLLPSMKFVCNLPLG